MMDDARLSELYDVSKAARDMRTQLATSLQHAQTAHKYGSLKESMRRSRFLVSQIIALRHQHAKLLHFFSAQPNFLPEQRVLSWNHWVFWSLFLLQLVFFLVMYR